MWPYKTVRSLRINWPHFCMQWYIMKLLSYISQPAGMFLLPLPTCVQRSHILLVPLMTEVGHQSEARCSFLFSVAIYLQPWTKTQVLMPVIWVTNTSHLCRYSCQNSKGTTGFICILKEWLWSRKSVYGTT